VNLEGVNLGALNRALVPDAVEVVTVDLSYLSLATTAPSWKRWPSHRMPIWWRWSSQCTSWGWRLRPSPDRARAVEMAVVGFEACGWRFVAAMDSPIRGARGAIEHLIHMERRR
jgi:predicted rRNA methylase YqxC with S4 and FtsJ domains